MDPYLIAIILLLDSQLKYNRHSHFRCIQLFLYYAIHSLSSIKHTVHPIILTAVLLFRDFLFVINIAFFFFVKSTLKKIAVHWCNPAKLSKAFNLLKLSRNAEEDTNLLTPG